MAKPLQPLTGLDALFVYLESMGTPMHVASLIRLESPSKRKRGAAEALKEHLIARLAEVPILRQRLVDVPLSLGHPVWQRVDRIDWDAHTCIETLRSPGGELQLNRLIAKLHAETLDRSRPLWRIHIIDGLAGGGMALYLKSHHALVDGQAGVQVTGAILDVEARPAQRRREDAESAASDKPATADAVARAALRAAAKQFGGMLRGLPEGVRKLASGARGGRDSLSRLRDSVWLAPRTVFNSQLGPKRRFATASLSLSEVRRIGKASGASLNDVVMALCAGALRAVLSRRGQLPDAPLIAAMPVSLREPGKDGGNEVSMVQCPLATDVQSPLERLSTISANTREIKGRVAAFRGLLPTDFPGLAAPIWASGLSRVWQRGRLSERLPPLANLVISNVPGPPVPLYVAGARVESFYPVSIVTHGLGLNITVLSYAGSLEVGIVSAPESMDRPDVLARALQRELERLSKATP